MQNHNNEIQDELNDYDLLPSMVVGKVTSGYKIITKDSTYKLQLKNDYQQGFQQEIVGLLNKRNLLLVNQTIENKNANSRVDQYLSQSLILMDLDKNIVDTLYELNLDKNELSMAPHVSKGDSLLFLFVFHIGRKSPNNKYYYPIDLVMIKINNGEIIKRINNFYAFRLNRGCQSGIFSPFNKYLVYSISDEDFDYEKYDQQSKKSNGLYTYNIVENKHQRILDIAVNNPLWSHNGNFIAYIYQGDVYFYNINSNETDLFYRSEDDSEVRWIKWHPSGKYIFIESRKQSKRWFHIGPGDGSYLTYQLFDIENGKELDTGGMFQEIGSSFYWR